MPGQQRSPGAAVRHLAGLVLPAGLRDRVLERRRRRTGRRRIAALVAADPALRAFRLDGHQVAGRLAAGFTAADAAEANLRIVTDAAEAAGVPYFLVPGRSHLRHAVGVRRADKKTLLDAMRGHYGDTEVYAAKISAAHQSVALYCEGPSRRPSSSRRSSASAGSRSARRGRSCRAWTTAATSSSGATGTTSPPSRTSSGATPA
nr:hypothetical protein GCM10025732_14540 [Glycomyces mayteni]